MYLDEVQPWLFVRNAHSLLTVIRHLQYEAHPALWFTLLYAVSRFSSNVVCMQCVNFSLAVLMAWIILSTRSLPFLIRVLLIFGVSVFYTTGVLARDYMLAGLLLTISARCLLADRPRHWAGMLCLALAINSHFLAIPVAISMCIWLYLLSPKMGHATLMVKLRDRTFWISVAVITVSLFACYFTVRPANDIGSLPGIQGATNFESLVLGTGRLWHYYLPITPNSDSSFKNGALTPVAYIDVILTLLLWVASLSVLPGRRSRYFMITASLFWASAAFATVRIPLVTHASFLIVSYIIALMINRPYDELGSWLPSYAAQPILIVILSMQVLICVQFCLKDWSSPFSAGKSVAEWLQKAGLVEHPLVVQPEIPAATVMAYTGISSVYFPACQCSRPYVLYSRGWTSERPVTLEELQSLKTPGGLSPVLLSGWRLSENQQRQLGLHQVFQSPDGWAFNNENVFVYTASSISGKP